MIEKWKWSSETPFLRISQLLELVMWMVHNHGRVEPSSRRRLYGESEANSMALTVEVDSAKALRAEVRDEGTVEIQLVERHSARGFVFDALHPEDGVSVFVSADVADRSGRPGPTSAAPSDQSRL